jgi:hypothetical protein
MSRIFAKLQRDPHGAQAAHPRPPQQPKDGKILGNKGNQESVEIRAASLPAQSKKEEEIKTATATLMLQNRAAAISLDSGAKKISVKTFPSNSNTQVIPVRFPCVLFLNELNDLWSSAPQSLSIFFFLQYGGLNAGPRSC